MSKHMNIQHSQGVSSAYAEAIQMSQLLNAHDLKFVGLVVSHTMIRLPSGYKAAIQVFKHKLLACVIDRLWPVLAA